MYSRILFIITISIATILLVGCESPEEAREREMAERIELELLEKQAEEDRLEREKQAEEDRLEREKQAEEDRLADIEREKKYAAAKRRDGISSKSQALSKCKNELRSMTNSGYYMNYSVETQRRMMTSQIDSCMYQYGYFGR
jgi:hypothetical protein